MVQSKILIRKVVTIDRHATGAITLGDIASLHHEPRYDPVDSGTLIVHGLPLFERFESSSQDTFLASAHAAKIFGRFGRNVCEELNFDTAVELCRVIHASWIQRFDVYPYAWVGGRAALSC